MDYHTECIQAALNYFYSIQSDNIYQNGLSYSNFGSVDLQGVELEVKYYLSPEIFLTGSSLYQTNKDEDGIKNTTPIANFGAKFGVSYKSEENGLTVSLFDIYQGELDDDRYSTTLNQSPDDYNILNFNSRLQLNDFFDWEPTDREVSLLFYVDNLLDEEIWLPNWGRTLNFSTPRTKGRTAYLGAEVSF